MCNWISTYKTKKSHNFEVYKTLSLLERPLYSKRFFFIFYFLNPFCLFINTDSIMYLIPEEPILLPWKTCCECYAFASVYVFSSAENVSVACLSTVAACTAILINHQFQGNPAEVLGRHNTFCHTCCTQLEHVLFFSLKISFLFHIT